MTSKPLIKLTNVSLSVPEVRSGGGSIANSHVNLFSRLYKFRDRRQYVRLLSGINFQLDEGERVGVVGTNGAGKSTFLKLLGGIYYPGEGEVIRNGTVKGLFDLSLGTNAEATGLENIYLRGLQMGLSLAKIRDLIPEIIDFSELGSHINKPLVTYSAGMRMRLILSISTLIDPDVLLLDEWIGAGDQSFKTKLKKRMEKMIGESKSLVLATHNFALIHSFCSRAVIMNEGCLVFDGDVKEAHAEYQKIILLRTSR